MINQTNQSDIGNQIWPFYVSSYARDLLSRWGNFVHMHEVDINQQRLGDIVQLELYMMQMIPSKMFSSMKGLFNKWYKSPNRANLQDASTLAYYVDEKLHGYFFKSGLYNYNTCQDKERFTSLYFLYTRQFACQDFAISTLKALCDMANAGVSDQDFVDMMMACRQYGSDSVPYAWKIYESNVRKQQIISQYQQNDIAYLNKQVISNSPLQTLDKELASSDDLHELWEAANIDS